MGNRTQHYQGCLLGLAAGDALGTSLEFQPPGSFTPLTDMVGGGPFGLKAGQWTDDTSMALCLALSLLEIDGFNPSDQMRRYSDWRTKGYMSSTGRCFDIGVTVSEALSRFQREGEPFAGSTHPLSAGNGSLMRLAPAVIYYHPNLEWQLHYSGESSRTTHGAKECIDACRYFAALLHCALKGDDKAAILSTSLYQPECRKIAQLQQQHYLEKTYSQLRGSGYVVECLEAALWCFAHTDSFEQAVLAAANLGDDADTTAAVCGQLAGAYYGVKAIPLRWLEKLTKAAEISDIAVQLAKKSHPIVGG